MAKFKMPWRSAKKDGLPKESGDYLVCDENAYWMTKICYSAKHKLFNCRDWYSEKQAHKVAIPVTYWIPIEEVIPDD